MGVQKSPGDRTEVRNSRDLNQSDFGSTHNAPPPKRSGTTTYSYSSSVKIYDGEGQIKEYRYNSESVIFEMDEYADIDNCFSIILPGNYPDTPNKIELTAIYANAVDDEEDGIYAKIQVIDIEDNDKIYIGEAPSLSETTLNFEKDGTKGNGVDGQTNRERPGDENIFVYLNGNSDSPTTFTIKQIVITYETNDYGLTVAGIPVTGVNADDILGDGKISFNNTSETLTLNNATISSDIITSLDALTINLEGTNTLSGSISYSGSASESTLAFSGTGSLTVSNGSQSVFNGFTSVTPGNDLYIATANPNILLATSATISTNVTYPIWIGNGELDGNSYTQVTATNLGNILGDEHKSVSYDRNGELTLKGAVISAASDYPGIFVGDITSLTVHLLGYSSLSGGFYFMENTNLNVTTSTTMPGKIVVGSNVATWASGKTGEVNCTEPLVHNNGTISIIGSSVVTDHFTGFNSTPVQGNEFSTSGNNYNAPDANVGNNVVKIALPTGGASSTKLWASYLSELAPSQIKKVYFQFDWGECENKNVKVQIKGIKEKIENSAPVWEDDGKVYSEAVSLSDTNDGIVEIELTKNLPVSDLIQLEFTSQSGVFSFVVLGVGYEEAKTYLIVDETPITEINYITAFGTENISFTPPSDGGSAVLSLKGGVTIGESGGTSNIIQAYVDDLTIEINGSNTINGSIEYSGDNIQSSSIQINKAEGATSASLILSNINSFGSCTWDEGLYLTAQTLIEEKETDAIAPYYDEEGYFSDNNKSTASKVKFSTTVSYPLWVGGVQVTDENKDHITGEEINGITYIYGTITFNPTGNILTLSDASIGSPSNVDDTPIISNLSNLEVNINGHCSLLGYQNGYISYSDAVCKSINGEAPLVFSTNFTSSTESEEPLMEVFHNDLATGFASVSTNNQIIYYHTSNGITLERLKKPTITVSGGKLLVSANNDLSYSNASISNGTIELKYKITDTSGTAGEEKIFDSETNEPITDPCTIDAWAVYQSQESDLVTGTYFGIADKTIVFNSTTSGSELKASDLELSPATEDVTFTIVNAYNSRVISYDAENGATIVGIGACNIDIKIDVDEGSNIQILNTPTLNPDSPGQQTVYIITKNITVIPDKPSIEKDAEHDYIETDKITITRTPVDNDDLPIFYTWSDDVEVETYQYIAEGGSVSIYNEPIPAQTGTLRAWVGYSAGDGYYYNSEVVSEEFTVFKFAEIEWESESQIYCTYYNPDKDMAVPSGSTAYIVTGLSSDGTKVAITPVSYIKAGVAVLIERNKTTEVSKTTDFSASKMNYSDPNTPAQPSATDKWYVIYNNKFVKVTSGTQVKGGKCYLNLNGTSSSGTRSYYDIDGSDGTTGIREVKSEGVKGEKLADSAWHDLQGRKFTTKPTKPGLYILNGKKVVIK